MSYREDIWRFEALNEQEAVDQRLMLEWIRRDGDAILRRENLGAHMTASALVLNPARTKVLLVFHNQFLSWSWVGRAHRRRSRSAGRRRAGGARGNRADPRRSPDPRDCFRWMSCRYGATRKTAGMCRPICT